MIALSGLAAVLSLLYQVNFSNCYYNLNPVLSSWPSCCNALPTCGCVDPYYCTPLPNCVPGIDAYTGARGLPISLSKCEDACYKECMKQRRRNSSKKKDKNVFIKRQRKDGRKRSELDDSYEPLLDPSPLYYPSPCLPYTCCPPLSCSGCSPCAYTYGIC